MKARRRFSVHIRGLRLLFKVVAAFVTAVWPWTQSAETLQETRAALKAQETTP